MEHWCDAVNPIEMCNFCPLRILSSPRLYIRARLICGGSCWDEMRTGPTSVQLFDSISVWALFSMIFDYFYRGGVPTWYGTSMCFQLWARQRLTLASDSQQLIAPPSPRPKQKYLQFNEKFRSDLGRGEIVKLFANYTPCTFPGHVFGPLLLLISWINGNFTRKSHHNLTYTGRPVLKAKGLNLPRTGDLPLELDAKSQITPRKYLVKLYTTKCSFLVVITLFLRARRHSSIKTPCHKLTNLMP